MRENHQGFPSYFLRLLSARCWASFLSPGLTDTTFGPRTFLSRALTRALSRGATRSSSSVMPWPPEAAADTARGVIGSTRGLVDYTRRPVRGIEASLCIRQV